jgi:hypothetical protein
MSQTELMIWLCFWCVALGFLAGTLLAALT